ncbi:LAMI_0G16446g1_1 [Lachancea mirantina]|uniref:LAMI_0G16446g1_1 n=1 Tax=Lachancea mirantina TaxID=1230905 RepID=A0A1G4KCN3_9SACH|nr:LAMI_0G16446g1_1 [Lachancea mirantina]
MNDKKRQRKLSDFDLSQTKRALPDSRLRPIVISLDSDDDENDGTENCPGDVKVEVTPVTTPCSPAEHQETLKQRPNANYRTKIDPEEIADTAGVAGSSSDVFTTKAVTNEESIPDPDVVVIEQKSVFVDVTASKQTLVSETLAAKVEHQEILCPLCGLVLTHMELHIRDQHCDSCAGTDKLDTRRSKKPLPPLPDVKKIHFSCYSIVVDGFNYANDPSVTQYFLSHFHADHYIGLKKSWCQGTVYCSKITAELLVYKLRLSRERLVILEIGKTVNISDRVTVTCFDANHCPGAVVFLFQEFDSAGVVIERVLHTGDFRSNDELINSINEFTQNAVIHRVYLDTTYMYPSFHFPMQKSVLDVTSRFAEQINTIGMQKLFKDRQTSILSFIANPLTRCHRYRYVFLVGTYTIGKEKVAVALAERLGTKIFLPKNTPKHRIIQTYEETFPTHLITHDVTKSCVHIVPLRTLSSKEGMQRYFKPISHLYEDMVAFYPTGWTFKNGGKFARLYETLEEKIEHTKWLLNYEEIDTMNEGTLFRQYNRSSRFQVFRVPYSEHSSFKDLSNFCVKMTWQEIIPTVNLHDPYMVSQMKQWFLAWKRAQEQITL